MQDIPRINFVTEPEEERWVLRRICEGWQKHIPESTITGYEPDHNADVNFFVNYNLIQPTDTVTFGWFTHREPGDLGRIFDLSALHFDWCFAQSELTMRRLPEEKSSVLREGIDPQFIKDPLVLGVVGRGYESGRKRLHWIPQLREDVRGVEIRLTGGDLEFEELPQFYGEIDYLLVTSNNEGGPCPVQEAIAMGKPVIAPNVGYCWEYPVIKYDGSYDDLTRLLFKITRAGKGWEESARQIIEKAQELLGC